MRKLLTVAASSLLNYRKAIGAALVVLAFAGLVVALRITRADLATERERNARLTAEIAALVKESNTRKAAGKQALEAAKPRVEVIERQIVKLVPAPNDGRCATNPDVLESDL